MLFPYTRYLVRSLYYKLYHHDLGVPFFSLSKRDGPFNFPLRRDDPGKDIGEVGEGTFQYCIRTM